MPPEIEDYPMSPVSPLFLAQLQQLPLTVVDDIKWWEAKFLLNSGVGCQCAVLEDGRTAGPVEDFVELISVIHEKGETDATGPGLPFPWPCPTCKTKSVQPTPRLYQGRMPYDGREIFWLFPELSIPTCSICKTCCMTRNVQQYMQAGIDSALRPDSVKQYCLFEHPKDHPTHFVISTRFTGIGVLITDPAAVQLTNTLKEMMELLPRDVVQVKPDHEIGVLPHYLGTWI